MHPTDSYRPHSTRQLPLALILSLTLNANPIPIDHNDPLSCSNPINLFCHSLHRNYAVRNSKIHVQQMTSDCKEVSDFLCLWGR